MNTVSPGIGRGDIQRENGRVGELSVLAKEAYLQARRGVVGSMQFKIHLSALLFVGDKITSSIKYREADNS